MNESRQPTLADALWRIYRRPDRPTAWTDGGNLPWNEPAFSERMLREHLDESHGAASRTSAERAAQIKWLWSKLQLQPGMTLCDVTCGPGLYAVEFARRGCDVTAIDFSPASIAHAVALAERENVAESCHFIEQDVREMVLADATFDAAILLYGQLSVFPKGEAEMLLAQVARVLKPGGRICIEMLDQEWVDKADSNWWFTDDSGLWGDTPFLHLGERFWDDAAQISTERFYTVHLDSGEVDEIHLSDQAYAIDTMVAMLHEAGFGQVDVFSAWDGVNVYDAAEWVVYVGQRILGAD